jgi:hypothetical protein
LGVLCPSNPAGLKSIGYALFHWGAIYSLENFPQPSGYTYSPGYFVLSDGTIFLLTSSSIVIFFALPIAIAGAGLLEPEIVRKFRGAGIGFVLLGLLMFTIAVGSFSLARRDLEFDLLGVFLSLTGVAMILYLYGSGWSIRKGFIYEWRDAKLKILAL